MGGRLRRAPPRRPQVGARGALAGDARRARRPRARAARRRLPGPSLADIDDPVRERLRAGLDDDADRRRLDARAARPLLLRARPHRPGALEAAAPLHRAGVAARAWPTRSARARTPARRGSSLPLAVVVPAARAARRALRRRRARAAPPTAAPPCVTPSGEAARLVRLLRRPLRASTCGGTAGDRAAAVGRARARRLLGWHERFTRFAPASELSRLNADPRARRAGQPRAGAARGRLVAAAQRTGGLVDGTLARPSSRTPATGATSGRRCRSRSRCGWRPPRRPARRAGRALARERDRPSRGRCCAGRRACALDGGGLAKGLCADLLAAALAATPRSWSTAPATCASAARPGVARRSRSPSPFGPAGPCTPSSSPPAAWPRAASAAAAGSTRRGRPAHHLLDPATGRPAFTGVVQATALAPTALEAEVLAKAALLGGPGRRARLAAARRRGRADDGSHEVIPAP